MVCHAWGTWHNCCTETSQEVTHQTEIEEATAVTQCVFLQESQDKEDNYFSYNTSKCDEEAHVEKYKLNYQCK
jgi:hypothetical protein